MSKLNGTLVTHEYHYTFVCIKLGEELFKLMEEELIFNGSAIATQTLITHLQVEQDEEVPNRVDVIGALHLHVSIRCNGDAVILEIRVNYSVFD